MLVEKVLAEFTSALGLGVFNPGLFVVNGEVAIEPTDVLSADTLPPCGRPEPVAVKLVVSIGIPVPLIKIFVVFAESLPHLKLDIPLTMMLWLRLKSGLGCPCEA